jgi:hypothetical protein
MTRRKREIVGLRNERDFPHMVELALPLGPLSQRFPRDRCISPRTTHPSPPRPESTRGQASLIRFCFPDTATADAFLRRPAFTGLSRIFRKESYYLDQLRVLDKTRERLERLVEEALDVIGESRRLRVRSRQLRHRIYWQREKEWF